MKIETIESIAEKYTDENGNIPASSIHAMCVDILRITEEARINAMYDARYNYGR
jgi:hypothetical protein